ncbi:MAG: DUF4145 domain-containing protein [Sulfurimonas sp.]|nr:DUF4145 domain-containing protein [Sulfurimonas sp.]MBU3940004.1 DUF4145 domain-containing protein [bacterium]MBU4023993.1 DUF4145 domain-containing protein [bacterium]MBU4058589.1 DUF4145 domain-containing protein [bacterium]
MNGFNWKCPHCERDVTITNDRFSEKQHYNYIDSSNGNYVIVTEFLICPNPDCNKYTLEATLYDSISTTNGIKANTAKLIKKWNLIPSSKGKVFPDYIPTPILNDYNEACEIKDLSPKASATLARRCLQGIIRDFWKVKPTILAKEIEEIEDKIDPLIWQAIDAVRKVGNIGAHMEKDINLIVDVEPHEAELLINLIETVLDEWYIAKYKREQKLTAITALSKAKDEERKI